jgi:hypothetical protein
LEPLGGGDDKASLFLYYNMFFFLVILNSFNVLTLKIKNNLENIILIYKKQHSTRQPFENYHH